MVIDTEVVLFVLCIWACVATGLALYYRQKVEKTDHILFITLLGLRKVAKGEASISLDSEGNMKFEGVSK